MPPVREEGITGIKGALWFLFLALPLAPTTISLLAVIPVPLRVLGKGVGIIKSPQQLRQGGNASPSDSVLERRAK